MKGAGRPLSKVKPRIVIERIPAPFASLYEKATRLVREVYYAQVAEEVVSSFKAGTILDLGTGPGYLPIEIVKRSPSMKCDGIDLSRKLIEMARVNASKAGVADRLNFEVGNAANLRFADGSYDMVISTGMLHLLKDPIKALKECYRVLKSGGEAWIYDPARISSQIDIREWKASLTFSEKFILRLFALYSLINPPNRYSRKQVIELIAATDFEEYRIEEEDKEIKVKLRK